MIETLKSEIIRFFITNKNKVLEETVSQFQSEANQNLKMWLELIQKNMRTYYKTGCSVSTLDDLVELTAVQNFETLACGLY